MTMEHPSLTALSKSTHPYAVRVSLLLGSNIELDLKEDEVRLPFATNYIIRIAKESANPREQAVSHKRVTVDLEAFPSASEAERAGRFLVLSLLWVAASKRVTIAFDQYTGEYPFAVRDRTQSAGISCRGYGRAFFRIKPEEFSSIAELAYKLDKDVPNNVITSMEIYASAHLESTARASFIGLMTALEALSSQCDYGDDIAAVLANLASQLEDSPKLAGEDKESLRTSLSNRLRQLRQESVRQSIIRMVNQYINDPNIIQFIDKAYGVRSKILHEGLRSPELVDLSVRIDEIMRQIYSKMLGLPLVVASGVADGTKV